MKKISILLPYKENFSSDYAGAVSLLINDTTKLSKYKKNIKIYSNKESNLIRLAFIIQLIIFFIIQFFEFSFELVQNVKRKNKK